VLVLNTLDLILIMCGATGAAMVIGSILLLYLGTIKLNERNADQAIEAEFKNYLKVNVRQPALGLFAIGLAFFGVALWFGAREGAPLILRGHIKIANTDDVTAKLRCQEQQIQVPSGGNFYTTIQPLEKFSVLIEAPGYLPQKYFYQINPDDAKSGRITVNIPEFQRGPGAILTTPKLDSPLSVFRSAGPGQ
jgi:hypothetical protein